MDSPPNLPLSQLQHNGANQLEKRTLQVAADSAILRLARALARQAAREDHARERAGMAPANETCCDLRTLFDRSSG